MKEIASFFSFMKMKEEGEVVMKQGFEDGETLLKMTRDDWMDCGLKVGKFRKMKGLLKKVEELTNRKTEDVQCEIIDIQHLEPEIELKRIEKKEDDKLKEKEKIEENEELAAIPISTLRALRKMESVGKEMNDALSLLDKMVWDFSSLQMCLNDLDIVESCELNFERILDLIRDNKGDDIVELLKKREDAWRRWDTLMVEFIKSTNDTLPTFDANEKFIDSFDILLSKLVPGIERECVLLSDVLPPTLPNWLDKSVSKIREERENIREKVMDIWMRAMNPSDTGFFDGRTPLKDFKDVCQHLSMSLSNEKDEYEKRLCALYPIYLHILSSSEKLKILKERCEYYAEKGALLRKMEKNGFVDWFLKEMEEVEDEIEDLKGEMMIKQVKIKRAKKRKQKEAKELEDALSETKMMLREKKQKLEKMQNELLKMERLYLPEIFQLHPEHPMIRLKDMRGIEKPRRKKDYTNISPIEGMCALINKLFLNYLFFRWYVSCV